MWVDGLKKIKRVVMGRITFASTSIGLNEESKGFSLNQPALFDAIMEADLIGAEVVSEFKKLCDYAGINPTARIETFDHYEEKKLKDNIFIDYALSGKKVLIVPDGGTAGLYDPGNNLIRLAIKEKIHIDFLPGANSILPAIIMSGFFDSYGFVSLGWIYKGLKENKLSEKYWDDWYKELFKNNKVPVSLLFSSSMDNYAPSSEIEKRDRTVPFLKQCINMDRQIFFVKNLCRSNMNIFRGTFQDFCNELEVNPEIFSYGILVIDIAKDIDNV